MNGPGHYRVAEEALFAASMADGDSHEERYALAAAQAHAVLALAAATVDAAIPRRADEPPGMDADAWDAWGEVLSS